MMSSIKQSSNQVVNNVSIQGFCAYNNVKAGFYLLCFSSFHSSENIPQYSHPYLHSLTNLCNYSAIKR